MAETDSPLKRLVQFFITDFAAWLLQTPVREVFPLNVELPTATLAVDQAFRVTLGNGQALLLHIEFQGRSSRPPLPWRMLEYMARLAYTHRLAMRSVVFYVGHGAGADDPGHHQVDDADGEATLAWRYQVIRLWQMTAEELLALESPALLALVGQTRFEQPEDILPRVIIRLRRVPDAERRGRLLTALLALLPDEEMVTMVERLLENDVLLLDTPYLRRIREEGREEGRQEGRLEGALGMRRRDILQALALRFTPNDPVYRQVAQRLEQVTDETLLEALFAAAIRSDSMTAFLIALDRTHQGEGRDG
jgi:predicted transposase YdaD